jgi:nucleoid-associated protein YgaU
MGIFDKMFGSEVKAALAEPNAQQRFEELKQKYQSVLNLIQQENVQLSNLHVQADKLFIRGTAPSEAVKNKIWDEIKLANPQYDDITADLRVQPQAAHAAAAGATSQPGAGPYTENGQDQTYMVQPGDSLSRIAERFYGSAHEYMKIYYANKEQISNLDQIRAGMKLNIPARNA